ncbi:DUF1311 domain-containing protein [Acinetobacter cumulans]|uniref:DUF1311 domain-containing protein n=1 Tax=Acinetobacter cumulans TaxID=2136182 RepID=A0A3A8G951_9GAMM|nr:DUF1311 domain-containing protein [Acinetobacter cumulans]RKG55577.1 DUF1311 domain-containing protein [Acinetobacter cumulans]
MKSVFIAGVVCSSLLLTACDFRKKDTTANEKAKLQDWSCSAPANVEQIQNHLKEDYLSQLDQRLRQSGYESDQVLLEKIRKNIKFEISHIATHTEQPEQAKQLECSSLLVAILPKGLQKRAENAYLEEPCDECDGEDTESPSSYTLQDSIKNEWSSLKLQDDKISGSDFKYSLERSDNDEISLSVESASLVGLSAKISELAVNFEAYQKRNKADIEANQQSVEEYNKENAAQTALAQKALDIRQKEVDAEQKAVVERLNSTWDRFSPEQKTAQQQDQSDWFEKRDVDCKVISQKRVYDLKDSELETYQQQHRYWNDVMEKQNQAIQYSQCFVQKTKERTVYLNNLFN